MELNADPSLDDTKSKPTKKLIWFEIFKGVLNLFSQYMFCVFVFAVQLERLRLSYRKAKKKK
jgi:hypothetical protein